MRETNTTLRSVQSGDRKPWLLKELAAAELPPPAASEASRTRVCVAAVGRNLYKQEEPFPLHIFQRLFFFSTPSHTHLKLAVIIDGDVRTMMTVSHTLLHLIIKDNPVTLGLFLFILYM